MAKMPTPKNVKEFVPDFDKWPEPWRGTQEDLEYGEKVLPFMEGFIKHLRGQNLSQKALKEYIDNLRLLRGTIIKNVSLYEEYRKHPLKKLREAVEDGGCLPGGYEDMSKSGLASFTRMCGKFEEFLNREGENPFHNRRGKA